MRISVPWMIVCGALVLGFAYVRLSPPDDGAVQCGNGFEPRGVRCCPERSRSPVSVGAAPEAYAVRCGEPDACPAPLVANANGRCEAPLLKVLVPALDLTVRASDWEAVGKDGTAHIQTVPFEIDAFEISVGQATCEACQLADAKRFANDDLYRAMSGLTREEAQRVCASRGGRLPTEAEWIAAASMRGNDGAVRIARYPWGDTGAVCRRDSWGLVSGPCGQGATLPDSVASHPDGTSSAGVHNMSGNVSEWVIDPTHPNVGIVRGGSFASVFAADLRVWARRTLDLQSRESTVGARCVYEKM